MVKSISANMARHQSIALKIDAAAKRAYAVRGKPVASWEDSQYSLNLVRSSFSSAFQLDRFTPNESRPKQMHRLPEVVKVDELAAPQKAVDQSGRRNWMRSNLLDKRNQKSFRP